jgi:hypothetical protein
VIVAELFAKLGLTVDKSSFDRGSDAIRSLHHMAEAYIGVGVLKQLKEMVTGTVEAAVEAKHLGERLGVTSESVQELGYAADVTGASSKDMTVGLQRLAAGLEHAKKGTGPLVDAMRQLQIPIANLRKENLEQNLEEIANGFQKAGPHVNKLAVAIEIFGRNAGPKLLPLLNRGASGIQALREEAQKLGVVMSEEMIKKSEEFEIAQKRLGATLTGLKNSAVEALLPALQEMIDKLQAWVGENREAIKSGLETAMHAIGQAFLAVGHAIAVATKFVQEHKEGVVLALKIIGATLAAFAIGAAVSWAIALWPIVALGAAVAGLIYVFTHLKEIGQWALKSLTDMWRNALKGAVELLNWIESLPSKAVEALQAMADAIVDYFAEAWQKVKDGFYEMAREIAHSKFFNVISGASGVNLGGTYDAFMPPKASAPTHASVTSRTTKVEYAPQFGAVTVQVDASNSQVNSADVGDIVAAKIKEHHDDVVRQTYDVMKGGRR